LRGPTFDVGSPSDCMQTPSFALQIMAVLAHRLRRGAPRV
jgi:hypothetical protein